MVLCGHAGHVGVTEDMRGKRCHGGHARQAAPWRTYEARWHIDGGTVKPSLMDA